MKSNRLNLCQSVRNTLLAMGYSTVKAVNAVNAALGELEVSGTKSGIKLGDGRLTKTSYKITETTTTGETFSGKANNIALRFDVFNSAMAKVEKVATLGCDDRIGSVALPPVFVDWLNKFAKKDANESANESLIHAGVPLNEEEPDDTNED